MATSPLPSQGSPLLQRGGQNQKWPTSGQSGYVTHAISGVPTASRQWGKSRLAHKWAKWLRHPCRLGDPHRFRPGGGNQKWSTSAQSGYVTPAVSGIPIASDRGGKIRSGPQVGKVARSPLPSTGSPPLESGRQIQKWPTCGQNGYVTPAVSGIPTAAEQGGKSEVAHKGAKWLRHPCRLGDPHRFRAGSRITSGPQVGKVATSPLPSRGSPLLQSGAQNQKWPTSGQSGYVTPAVSGIPTASGGGAKSEGAHQWAKWLRHPCRLGDPHRFKAGGGNQKWPTCGQTGYVAPAVSGIPTAAERWREIKSGPLMGKVAMSPPLSQGSGPRQSGGKIRSGPHIGKVPTSPLPSRESPPLDSGGGNEKWPISGQSGYVTLAASGIPTASERGGGGGDQKWPTRGQSGYAIPTVSGIPAALERGGKSDVPHKRAKCLRHRCRLRNPHHFKAGGKIRSGPSVGKVATSPLPSRGSPLLERGGGGGGIRSGPEVGKGATSPLPSGRSPPPQSGGGNPKWPRKGQSGYVGPAISEIPTASEQEGGRGS